MWALGWAPGGAAFYRKVTRDWLGTQATHVDKLARVVPGYVAFFQTVGFEFAGKTVAVLDPGMTTFWPMAAWLLTGRSSHCLQMEAAFHERYISRSAGGVLESLPTYGSERRDAIESLRWAHSIEEVLTRCTSGQHLHVPPGRLPLESDSIDLFHSGGTLEHFRPHELVELIKEAFRVVAPGGIYSAVHDHRDHLYHADKSIEPMNHLRHSEPVYRFLYGHKLLYHNRLSPTRVATLMKDVGFEQVALRRMVLPEQKYVSDEDVLLASPGCSRLAKKHVDYTPLDVRTAACHYVYRKPV